MEPLLICSVCAERKPSERFSKSQIKKDNESRRCKSCIDEKESIKRAAKRKKREIMMKRAKRKKEKKYGKSVDSVSDVDVEVCAKVLRYVQSNPEVWTTERFKIVRRVINPVIEICEDLRYSGKTRSEFDREKKAKRARKLSAARERAYDMALINKRKLRRGRLEKLQSLINAQGDLPLIPDGAVNTESMVEESTLELVDEEDSASAKEKDLTSARQGALAVTKTEASSGSRLHRPRSCYTCKTRFRELHTFYDQLCPTCADLNWRKREQTADMRGMYVLLTGGRVKIGFQCGLKLLRCGANVIVTTRFPKDAASRYLQQPDASVWRARLQIVGIDLRDIARLEAFCEKLNATLPGLDAVINNACQTIRRPPSYYAHLMPLERKSLDDLPSEHRAVLAADDELSKERLRRRALESGKSGSEGDASSSSSSLSSLSSAAQSQIAMTDADRREGGAHCPRGKVDVNGQQVDLRRVNSWKLLLGDVQTPEIAEVFAINALAPFVINSKLKPLMLRARKGARSESYVVNVSAMEGKFYRHKGPEHPHTNMAKAALNMMTRTCAADLSKHGIFMNSVDTGWINDENPLEIARRTAKMSNFQTPIDEIDAAARILDPIMVGINERDRKSVV